MDILPPSNWGTNMRKYQSGVIALVPAVVSAVSVYVLSSAEFLQNSLPFIP
jgi:hypothetical protein